MATRPMTGGTLVSRIHEQLKAQITSGRYRPGERLPSEARMTQEHGVSRTVVREAIAALKADGLVDPQRGAGVFVIEPEAMAAAPFDNLDPARLSSMIEILELRIAIEVEAAGLAAMRCAPAHEERILAALQAMRGAPGIVPEHEADFSLHLAIAEATNNPRFAEILRMLGTKMIPRHALTSDTNPVAPEYLDLLRREHEDIVTAILDGNAEAARDAMRRHLKGSQRRYRQLLRREPRD